MNYKFKSLIKNLVIVFVFISASFHSFSQINNGELLGDKKLEMSNIRSVQFETIIKFKSSLTNDELKLVVVNFNQLTYIKKWYFDENLNSLHIVYDAVNKDSMQNEINSFFSNKKINIESLISIKYDNKI